ncbi:MAG: protein kinase family protein [Planctomycetota bacterium]|jgi:hypothetical protein
MFALASPPAATVELPGATYRLARVFKHDFFAATCLYEAARPADAAKIVVKYMRTRAFLGLPMGWAGRLLAEREQAAYAALAGLEGVARWLGRVGQAALAVGYVKGRPLDQANSPPPGFFDRLRELFDGMHARGVAYGDANKRSNIIVSADGRPFLVDFQLSVRRRDDLPWPLDAIVRGVVRYMAGRDIYHLYKHKRRMSPSELTDEELVLSRRRGALHSLHRHLAGPWRFVRRRLLRRLNRKGKLISPTEHLEDHYQPEKAAWRERRT